MGSSASDQAIRTLLSGGPSAGGGAGLARGRLAAQLAGWWRDAVAEPVLSVLFPPRCVGCRDFESHLCASCRDSLEPIGSDHCPRCGEPGPLALVSGRCRECLTRELSFAGARGAFRHTGVARRLVAEFKFGGQPVLGRIMAELARPAFAELACRIGRADGLAVTWVPCHKSARRERGYNQAELLARFLARGPEALLLAPLVRKTAATKHQKGLGRAGRQQNLRGVFALDDKRAGQLPAGTEAVVLVDNVYTTGATAKEVSTVLAAGIGIPVYVFTFSRAVAAVTERHD